jgi:predicted Ser/Thr protein kinase
MNQRDSNKDCEAELDRAFARYLQLLDSEAEVPVSDLLAQHPDVADQLQECIDTARIVQHMAGPTIAQSSRQQGADTSRVHDGRDTQVDVGGTPGRTEGTLTDEVAGCLPDRYRIERLLGHGAMGAVYLAYDQQLDRHVALKTPTFGGGNVQELVERFYREARAAATLRHPGICPIYDVGQANGIHYISMAYIEGATLSALIRERALPDPLEITKIIRSLALALQKAHEKGVVHRDLKPGNVMIDADNEPIIMDFGLAHRIGEETRLTQSGVLVGSPAYMSPEQIEGKPENVGPATDIYSLGVIMYEMLTGQLPYEGSILSIIGQIGRDAPPAPSRRRPEIPSDSPLERICLRMMGKRPEDRYATMADVAAALAAFKETLALDGTSGQQPPKPIGDPTDGTGRRAIVPCAVIALVLLGLLGVLAGVIHVATDRGQLEICSEANDVRVIVKRGGSEIDVFDVETGSQVRWLSTGEYHIELVGEKGDVVLDRTGFRIKRLGKVVVTARRNPAGLGVVRAFGEADPVITRDGVTVDEGGWKITADERRTVRLFELPEPGLDTGPFFYRAKMRSEDVQGRAYLEMWVRLPGVGEFFSKGFHMPLSGTNGWAEYEIPFLLEEGQRPDLVKLNVTIEGTGTVWIKDIQLRGRVAGGQSDRSENTR